MMQRWVDLSEVQRVAYRAASEFLRTRLEERPTIEWALRLKPRDRVKRWALIDLLDRQAGDQLGEPWLTAWRLIEESWRGHEDKDDVLVRVHLAKDRLHRGERSGSLVTAIVDLVVPQLEIESVSARDTRRRPHKVRDLLRPKLTSGEVVSPSVLDIAAVAEPPFLLSLASALNATVAHGLDMARRIGWDGEYPLWKLGSLGRVYYVSDSGRGWGEHEPDEFNRGLAPSVKLLEAVVSRLFEANSSAAQEFIRGWKLLNTPVHLRLWAALSRDARVTPADEVAAVLLSLDERRFWRLADYPEIAELRARRFAEFSQPDQRGIVARIRKLPPRGLWPRKAERRYVQTARLSRAVSELRRIELGGGHLADADRSWLNRNLDQAPEIDQMTRVDSGFSMFRMVERALPNPDSRYDALRGEDRLKALEAALATTSRSMDTVPADQAADWLGQPGRPTAVLSDLESVSDGGATFSRVWEQLGWIHSPQPGQGQGVVERDLADECGRVLSLLTRLPDTTLHRAIEGITYWLSNWERQVADASNGFRVWFKLWPIATETTDAAQPQGEEIDLSTVGRSADDREPMDPDTLNTPAGRLVGVFLATCPDLNRVAKPFDADGALRRMRDAVILAKGRSGLIARHRMIEFLPYFMQADPEWTDEFLVAPLKADDAEALPLWRAVARKTRFTGVLAAIGDLMIERATDNRLGRETRRSLVFSLIIECLHAYKETRAPAVPYPRVQQMLRSLDDEVRAQAAQTVQRFVHDLSQPQAGIQSGLRETIFREAAAPFLREVWPQERSLATPGVSRALADLPATSGDAFAEAVQSIERFLVPFECWSLLEYGLFGEEDGHPKLSMIDSAEKASALLRLLELTISKNAGAVVPHGLADALDQVHNTAPKLAETRDFRRLAAAARGR